MQTTYLTPAAQASYANGRGAMQAKRHLGHTLHNTLPTMPRGGLGNGPLATHVWAKFYAAKYPKLALWLASA